MTALIRIQNLTVESSQHCILDDVSLTLDRGESLTILGQTGSGKSILAQVLLGNLPANLHASGEVCVNTIDPLRSPKIARQRLWGKEVALLPQEPWHALNPVMTVRNQLREVWRWVRGQSAADADSQTQQDLTRLGLADAANKIPQQLSGGMAQRGAFAIANAIDSDIFIADEPTKGLDSSCCNTVLQLLKQKQQQGTLLTITHDIALAEALGGNIMVMKHGKIVEQGTAPEVLRNPQHRYTRQLLAAAPSQWNSKARRTDSHNEAQHPLVSAESLTIERDGNAVLTDLSLTLQQNEVVGLSGDSGSGKSTLGDTLLGLLPYQAGLLTRRPNIAAGEQLKLYQDPPTAFATNQTLGGLLNEVCQLHRVSTDEIVPLMKQLNLSPALLERKATEVSGGELQRLALLRIMLIKPNFIVADEPTSRLDPLTAKQVMECLIDYSHANKATLLLISHDHLMLNKVCDRVVSLKSLIGNGR